MPSHSFSFCGSGGYVGLSADADVLEEYLRSGDSQAKSLREVPGLAEAAQKVGGTGTGLFGYEDQSQGMRSVIETLRKEPLNLMDLLGSTQTVPGVNPMDQMTRVREWADFSLLPSYDSIAKYFYFSVFAGGFGPDGFIMNFFAPTPPKLR